MSQASIIVHEGFGAGTVVSVCAQLIYARAVGVIAVPVSDAPEVGGDAGDTLDGARPCSPDTVIIAEAALRGGSSETKA